MAKSLDKDKNPSHNSAKTSKQSRDAILKYSLYLSFVALLILLSITLISGEDDFFWHLASGKYIVENMKVPSTDVFSHVTYGQQWIPFEWGWDVMTFLIFNSLGYPGIYIFKIILILLIFLVYSRILDRLKLGDSLKITFLLILCWGMLFRFSIRPHLISYLFYVLILYIIISYKYFDRQNYKRLYYLPIIFLIWANLHIGVIIGAFIFTLFVISEVVIYLLPGRFSGQGIAALNKKEMSRLFIMYVVCLAVMLINPNGILTYLYAYSLTSSKLIYELGEYKSPFDSIFNSSLAMTTYKIMLGCGIFALIYSLKKKDLFAFLLFAFFAIYSLRGARFAIDYNIIASFPIFMGILYLIRQSKRKGFKDFVTAHYGFKLILMVVMLFMIVNIPNDFLFNGIFRYYRRWGVGIDREFFSQPMFDFAKSIKLNEIGERPFNNYTCGGLFLWNFPGSKNFIDSRYVNDQVYSEYGIINSMKAGFVDRINKYGIDYVIYEVAEMRDNPRSLGTSVVAYLSQKSDEWKLIYWDDISFIFVKNIPKFEQIISKYEYKYVTPINYFFKKQQLDKAYLENKERFIYEVKRKLKEEPNGDIIRTFTIAYGVK
jgi:hypothetical protein